MRILLITHQFLPDHTTGTEVLTGQVALELVRRGHEVRIFTGYPVRKATELRTRFDRYAYRGIRVDRYFHTEQAPIGSQTNPAEIEYENHCVADWLRSHLAEWRPDVVHFFHLKYISASAIRVCHEQRLLTVLTPTDFWLICPTVQLLLPDGSLCAGPDARGVNCLRHAVANTRSPGVRRVFDLLPDRVVTWLVQLSDVPPIGRIKPFALAKALAGRRDTLRQRAEFLGHVLAPTRFMQRMLSSNGICPDRISLCRFGIDSEGYVQPAVRRGSSARLRIGFIGSLARPKGAHVLVGAVRATRAELPVELKLYGDPNVYPTYTRELVELAGNDPRIRFCGTFPNEHIGSILAELDVLVIPSIWYENTPLVIYSAQAAGCPIVASDLPGIAEVVRDGVDGLLFPPGDTRALATLVEALCGDRQRVARLADNVPEPKSIGGYVDDIEATYVRLKAERGSTD